MSRAGVRWAAYVTYVTYVTCATCAATCLGRTLGAQAPSTAASSTAWVGGGLGVQSDGTLTSGVQLSPVGAIAALGFSHTMSSGFDFGVRASASFYPQVQGNRVTLTEPSGGGSDPDGSLTMGTLAAEFGPHRVRGASWFACAGGAFALTTPRRYDRAAPMACAGVTVPMNDRAAVRVSFEWMIRELGRTRFQIPLIVSYATPF